MLKHFRPEFEEHMEAARARRELQELEPLGAPELASVAGSGAGVVARPEQNWITFEIDGRQVRAPEGAMLVDAAKEGDVEIPYFCYEPKLGPAGRRLPHVPRGDRGHPEAADRRARRRCATAWW